MASERNSSLGTPAASQYGVLVPCEPSDFGEFISGLLGKPRTIEKAFEGVFTITRQDVINTFHLIDQRIRQQNQATRVRVQFRIGYNDNSLVELNSLEDFEHYTEVRPIVSERVELSLAYLVTFQGKNSPEKQEIDLSFSANPFADITREDGIVIRRFRGPAFLGTYLRIAHTERTWGVDLESLLTGHIKTLVKSDCGWGARVSRHSGWVAFGSAAALVLGAFAGVFWTASMFVDGYREAVSEALAESTDGMTGRMDVLLDVAIGGAWPRFMFAAIAFLVFSLVAAISFAGWIDTKAMKRRPGSFVLLSRVAEDKWKDVRGRQRRDWTLFGLSLIGGLVVGLVSNMMFMLLFKNPG